MVLTRASSSRLGTPLASPLPDPNRPSTQLQSNSSNRIGPVTISARDRVLALRRSSVESSLLSSPTASTSTISSPPSPTSGTQNAQLNQFSLINSRLDNLPPRSPTSPFSINMTSNFEKQIERADDQLKTPVKSRKAQKKGSSSKKVKPVSNSDKTPTSRSKNQTPVPPLNLHTQDQEISQTITKKIETEPANSEEILKAHFQHNQSKPIKDEGIPQDDASKHRPEDLEKIQPGTEKLTLSVETQLQSPKPAEGNQDLVIEDSSRTKSPQHIMTKQSESESVAETFSTKTLDENINQDEPNVERISEADQSNSTKQMIDDSESTHTESNHEKEPSNEILAVESFNDMVVEQPEAERIPGDLEEQTQPATNNKDVMSSSKEAVLPLPSTALSITDHQTSSEAPPQTTTSESSIQNPIKPGASLALDLTDCHSSLVPSLPILSANDSSVTEEDSDLMVRSIVEEKMMIESDHSATLDGNTEHTISPYISSNLSSTNGWTEEIKSDHLCTPQLMGSEINYGSSRVHSELEVMNQIKVDLCKSSGSEIESQEKTEGSCSNSDGDSDSDSDADLDELLKKARNNCEKLVSHEFIDGSNKILFQTSATTRKNHGLTRPLTLNSLTPLTGIKPTTHSTKPEELPVKVKDLFGMMPPPLVPNKKKLDKKDLNKKLGWHDLPYQEITPEVKREIQAMRLHGTLDPKRFVKGGIEKRLKEPIPDRFQFGHLIPSGQSSSTAKESIPKKRSFVEALIEDEEAKKWAKKKFINEVQTKATSGGKVFWKNLQQKRHKN